MRYTRTAVATAAIVLAIVAGILMRTISSDSGSHVPTPARPVPSPAPRPPSPVFDAPTDAHSTTARGDPTPGFVRIEAGTFAMGSPARESGRSPDETQHDVRISRAFEMQATEVTQREYRALVGENPSHHSGCGDCPVEQVSWFEAVRYCNLLSRRRGLRPCVTLDGTAARLSGLLCEGYRLPTEAEWEYAARAGTRAARYGDLDLIAWYDGNSGLHSHPVARKQPNAWGLFDMLGNVFEWVWDWKDACPDHLVADPVGPSAGDNRAFRGGAYRWTGDEARAAFRNAYGPLNQVEFIGFRCVRTLP